MTAANALNTKIQFTGLEVIHASEYKMKMVSAYRARIDELNQRLVEILVERMDLVRELHAYKTKKNYPIEDKAREREMMAALKSKWDSREGEGRSEDWRKIEKVFKILLQR